MTTLTIVSLISLLGWLALMLTSWRSQKISRSATWRMVLIWAGIILGITLVMQLITE